MPQTIRQYARLLAKTSWEGGFPAVAQTLDGPRCKYRTPKGKGCDIGVLIPDDEYDPSMENWTADNLFQFYPDLVEAIIPEGMSVEDLGHIQYIHDSMTKWNHQYFIESLSALPCFRDVIEELV